MSSEKIVHDILKTNLAKAKDSLERLLYEKITMAIAEKRTVVSICEKKKKKDEYADETDKEDDGEGLDPVGAADSDVDNDGDSDESDDYLKNRRRVRSKAITTKDYIKQKPDGTWCVYNDTGKVVKEFDSKSAAENFLKEEVKQLDEFLPMIAMWAAKKIGGRILKGVGRKLLGKAKSAVSGLMGGGEKRTESVDASNLTTSEDESQTGKKTIYGMSSIQYMKLTDEQKDQVRDNYRREKKQEEVYKYSEQKQKKVKKKQEDEKDKANRSHRVKKGKPIAMDLLYPEGHPRAGETVGGKKDKK